MEKLNQLTGKEKEQLLRCLGSMYRKGSFHENEMLQGMVEDSQTKNNEMEVTAFLQFILGKMNRKYAMIILNDFFEVKDRNWWHSMYSPSTYYRCKKAAVDLLLNQLYSAQ